LCVVASRLGGLDACVAAHGHGACCLDTNGHALSTAPASICDGSVVVSVCGDCRTQLSLDRQATVSLIVTPTASHHIITHPAVPMSWRGVISANQPLCPRVAMAWAASRCPRSWLGFAFCMLCSVNHPSHNVTLHFPPHPTHHHHPHW
jgi:hypothetical protein